MKPSFSIGIEEEYQTIDPVTFDLRSHINAEIIAKGKRQLDEPQQLPWRHAHRDARLDHRPID